MSIMAIIGIIASLIIFPAIFFLFFGQDRRHKREKEVEKLKYQKEIAEMEIEKEKLRLKTLEEENRKLDKIIDLVPKYQSLKPAIPLPEIEY